MPQITDITKTRRGTFTVEVSNGEKFSVSADIIADFGLYQGMELSEEELSETITSVQKRLAKSRAINILGTRLMSKNELASRLMKKGEPEDIAIDTAEWMERNSVINDEEYARAIVRHYSKRGYGIARIKDELYKRGIERDLRDEVLASDCPDGADTAYAYLQSKYKGADIGDATKKVTDSLFRRGFGWDEINSAVRRYVEDFGEDYE